ncbi:MAG: hypothetical protein V2B18_22725 [Pseudomonadota bacterium]
MNEKGVPPSNDQIELSLFGSGFGEAILIHFGNNHWAIVDSCLEPASRKPASLVYMETLGIDWAVAVKLIVISHWHDDHIRGISSIVEKCPAAEVFISAAMKEKEFRKLVVASEEQDVAATRGIDEFSRIFAILEERKQSGARFNPPKIAIQDRPLLHEHMRVSGNDFEVKITALSPSDASVYLAQRSFDRLYAGQIKSLIRVPPPEPNDAAVALWVEIGCHKILLGSDLESGTDPTRGWAGVLSNFRRNGGPAGIFKKAHHGAATSHHPRLGSELLSTDAHTMLTTWFRGGKWLPTEKDIERIKSLTCNAYITSQRPGKYSYKDKLVREFRSKLTRLHAGWGQIRIRTPFNDPRGIHVELFDNAIDLRQIRTASS